VRAFWIFFMDLVHINVSPPAERVSCWQRRAQGRNVGSSWADQCSGACDGVNLTGTGFEDEGLVREGGDILTLRSEESGIGEE
jgi:hypothetical protein